MNLTDLKIGEIGFIKSIHHEKSLINKLVEMGFVEGEEIQIMHVSPFKDSVIVKIMDYKLSLSFDEAKNIEITKIKCNEEQNNDSSQSCDNGFRRLKEYLKFCDITSSQCENCRNYILCKNTNKSNQDLKFVLVGNPNCGKTTLYNLLTKRNESTGNYSGVTLDIKSDIFYFDNYKIHIYDLPGIYSLNWYYNEEKVTINFLKTENIDLVINVIDSTKLKRSLFLTYELKKKYRFLLCAFNLYDEFKLNGYNIDFDKFEDNFEIFTEPTISKNGRGVNNLIKKGINIIKYIKANNLVNYK